MSKFRYEISIELTGEHHKKELFEIIKSLDNEHDCNSFLVAVTDKTDPIAPRHYTEKEVNLINEVINNQILEGWI